MKKLLALLAMAALVSSAYAATLYEQEGNLGLGVASDDDPVEVDAAGQAPDAATANWTNWKYQTGSGSWSGVYAAGDGWVTESENGDMDLKVEADVEMYFSQTVEDNEIYFHIGNIFTATANDLTAFVPGSYTTNNGQYIGISFQGTGKTAADFEKIGSAYTGKIIGGMQSDHDTYRAQDNQMDVQILMSTGSGFQPPVIYGDGAHGTVTDTLWWNPAGTGTVNYQWRVRLLPTAAQPDGDYYLDPAVVATPML